MSSTLFRFCDELSKSDKCWNLKCDEKQGKCVDSTPKVNCPAVTACRTQSTCNRKTGTCDIVDITPADCKATFLTEAAKHYDDSNWFADESKAKTFYDCGEAQCSLNPGTETDPSKRRVGNCIFTPGDSNTCGACSGIYPEEMSFAKCEQRAVDLHNNNKDTCYTSKCVGTSETTSKCVDTEKKCDPKPCMTVECNQNTLQCEYKWTDDYLSFQSQENSCQQLRCIDNTPVLVNITEELCLGDDDKLVPVCKVFDRCDKDYGCIYKDKCQSNNYCTVVECDASTNTCKSSDRVCEPSNNVCYRNECSRESQSCEPVTIPVEQACGETDVCHEMTCNVLENKCILSQIPYPNETDLCHNYTCDNVTGLWSVTEKCDDGNICTVDSCTLYDGSCQNFQRDCSELNMSGLGSCFGRSCSKLRKNGCFRKVYENSYFDECGNCIRGYTAGDSGLTDSETSDCKKALSFQEEAAIISAGVLAAIIIACVVGALGVSAAGTLATRELIRRAREANNNSAHDNPLFQDNGREMENPAFEGDEE